MKTTLALMVSAIVLMPIANAENQMNSHQGSAIAQKTSIDDIATESAIVQYESPRLQRSFTYSINQLATELTYFAYQTCDLAFYFAVNISNRLLILTSTLLKDVVLR